MWGRWAQLASPGADIVTAKASRAPRRAKSGRHSRTCDSLSKIADYRGPLGVLLVNLGTEPYTIAHGERIAQLVVAPVARATFEVIEALSGTRRGSGGFGSTGRH